MPDAECRMGIDVAGMGRDSSVFCRRYDNYVSEFDSYQSGGKADHMHIAGKAASEMQRNKNVKAFIDTIGEGAGVYSRLEELELKNAYSCKFSEGAKGLSDITGQYKFANMRAYLFWAIRDWLNPKYNCNAALPPCEKLMEEATNIRWFFQSNGTIIIEPKEKIKLKIKRSPDFIDALANTFYPHDNKVANIDDALSGLL